MGNNISANLATNHFPNGSTLPLDCDALFKTLDEFASLQIWTRLLSRSNNLYNSGGGLPKLSGFVCAYHSAVPGLNHKHTIYAYLVKICAIFVIALRKGRNKQKKRSGLPIIRNFLNNNLAGAISKGKNVFIIG